MICSKIGSGKTAATLEALKNTPGKIIIIAPLLVCENTWVTEIKKWKNFENLKFCLWTGKTIKSREKNLNPFVKIIIVNPESISTLLVKLKYYDWLYSRKLSLVIDESTTFKSHSTLRFKLIKSNLHHFKHVVLLTGTPIGNSLIDLWSQIYLLDKGERLGKTITNFRNKFFFQCFNKYKWKIKSEKHQKEILESIKDICIKPENDINFCKKEIDFFIDLSPREEKYYKQMKNYFKIETRCDEITAVTASTIINKLVQITRGCVYVKEKEYECLGNSKIKALEYLVNIIDENIIVVYNYNFEKIEIHKYFPEAVNIKEKNAIKEWNEGKIRLLTIHPQSGGYGLNLQQGGRVVIWMGPIWSSIDKNQTDGRVSRMGQKEEVQIIIIKTKNTIDEHISNVLEQKIILQKMISAYLA